MKSAYKTIIVLTITIFASFILAKVFHYPNPVFEGLDDMAPAPAPSPSLTLGVNKPKDLASMMKTNKQYASGKQSENKELQSAVKEHGREQNRATSKAASGTPSKQSYQSEKQKKAEDRLAQGRKDVDEAKGLQKAASDVFKKVEGKRQVRDTKKQPMKKTM